MPTSLKRRVEELIEQHGGVRKAARAIDVDPAYLIRMRDGEKTEPSIWVLRKMGLERVVLYRRID